MRALAAFCTIVIHTMFVIGRLTALGMPRADARSSGRGWVVVVALLMAGCSSIPRDPDGTLERVSRDRSFSVGIVASGARDAVDPRPTLFLRRVAARTGAAARVHTGAAERLLSQLEHGELDLVIGELSDRSPWRERVTMLPKLGAPLDGRPDVALTVAARHGENAWLGLLFEEVVLAGGAR
jgi:hypothetical protein